MKYVISHANGSVSIMDCVIGSPEDAVAKWPAELRDSVVSIHPMPDEVLDRTYRNAWTYVGGKIDHDMPKCREIHRSRMRLARVPLLEALDVEYQRADETGDNVKKRDIAKEKQRLRDVTKHPDIDAAQTVDDLKKVWPI